MFLDVERGVVAVAAAAAAAALLLLLHAPSQNNFMSTSEVDT